jgi:predicted homoserine dehydrogenase-like protein
MVCRILIVDSTLLHRLTLAVAGHRKHVVMVNIHVEVYVHCTILSTAR